MKKGGKGASPKGRRGREAKPVAGAETPAGDTATADQSGTESAAAGEGAAIEIEIEDGAAPTASEDQAVEPGTEDGEAAETEAADGVDAERRGAPLAERLEAAQAELAGRHQDWLRALAEVDNLRKRSSRELLEQTRRAREGVLVEFLAVMDDVERAIEAIHEGGDQPETDGLRQGVELIHTRLLAVLARFEVRPMECVGEEFDPHQHEAVMRDDSTELEPDHVTQVMQKGYRIGEQVLRPARVAVSS